LKPKQIESFSKVLGRGNERERNEKEPGDRLGELIINDFFFLGGKEPYECFVCSTLEIFIGQQALTPTHRTVLLLVLNHPPNHVSLSKDAAVHNSKKLRHHHICFSTLVFALFHVHMQACM
jgi:hypothetical protein